MKICLLIIGTLFTSLHVFSQDESQNVKVLDAAMVLRGMNENRAPDQRMNVMPVTPLLTDKIYIAPGYLDAYRLPGGMICLVPDSTVVQKLNVVKPSGVPIPVRKY